VARVARTILVPYEGGHTEQKLQELVRQSPRECKISFSESWTDEALRYLRREKHKDSQVKLVALNYANCTYPGGNYSDGGMVRAQEEELCRLFPALFESLKGCEDAGGSFDDGREMCRYGKHVFGPTFQDGKTKARNVLMTEEVQCLRANAELNYQLLQLDENKVSAGFVEAAAPIFRRGWDGAFQHFRDDPKEWYEKVFLNVFYAPKSLDESYDVIVIGPWGCGAFGNDPDTVAKAFLNIIEAHHLKHLYKEIHFCLGRQVGVDQTVGGACNTNVQVFRAKLGQYEYEDYTADLQAKAARWMAEELQEFNGRGAARVQRQRSSKSSSLTEFDLV